MSVRQAEAPPSRASSTTKLGVTAEPVRVCADHRRSQPAALGSAVVTIG
ncbi:hypothetical protein [Nocardia sp. NPDC058705]